MSTLVGWWRSSRTHDGTAKITNFGIARATGDVTVAANGMLVGTVAHLPQRWPRPRTRTTTRSGTVGNAIAVPQWVDGRR